MSLKHTFTCNRCENKIDAKYNGEHFLPPEGWMELYDPLTAKTLDIHLCKRCTTRAIEQEPKAASESSR